MMRKQLVFLIVFFINSMVSACASLPSTEEKFKQAVNGFQVEAITQRNNLKNIDRSIDREKYETELNRERSVMKNLANSFIEIEGNDPGGIWADDAVYLQLILLEKNQHLERKQLLKRLVEKYPFLHLEPWTVLRVEGILPQLKPVHSYDKGKPDILLAVNLYGASYLDLGEANELIGIYQNLGDKYADADSKKNFLKYADKIKAFIGICRDLAIKHGETLSEKNFSKYWDMLKKAMDEMAKS